METLDQQTSAQEKQPQEKSGSSVFISELIRFVLIAVFVVLPIRVFIAQPFIVSGSSMEDTFSDGQYLIVDEISYRFEDPQRGDVIIFKYPQDTSKFFIKRIIGLPGEGITITGGNVFIANEENPNGFQLQESYLDHQTFKDTNVVLKENEYFVMGDNRPASSDSRFWGPLEEDFIVGRAFVRLLPVTQIDLFPGEYRYTQEDSKE